MKVVQNYLEIKNIVATNQDFFSQIHLKTKVIDMSKVTGTVFSYCDIANAKIINMKTDNLDEHFEGCVFRNCEFDESVNREPSKKDNIILVDSLKKNLKEKRDE